MSLVDVSPEILGCQSDLGNYLRSPASRQMHTLSYNPKGSNSFRAQRWREKRKFCLLELCSSAFWLPPTLPQHTHTNSATF